MPLTRYNDAEISRVENLGGRTPPPPGGALNNLKVLLGLYGRADFITARDDWPGDLTYSAERIVIFVRGCVMNGCPQHCISLPQRIIESQAYMIKAEAKVEDALKRHGWLVLSFFECEVAANAKTVAEEILAALATSRKCMPDMISQSLVDLARLAHMSVASRVSSDAHKAFLRFINSLPPKFKKMDAKYAAYNEGWTPEVFETLWRAFAYHEIINIHSVPRIMRGKLFDAAMLEAGIPRGAEPWYRRKPMRTELIEQDETAPGASLKKRKEEPPRMKPSTPLPSSTSTPHAPSGTT